MGRSRGGLTTKIHALVNENGLPLRFLLTPGEAHDAPPCRVLLDAVQPNQRVLADKAYDADWIRQMIWERGAVAVIPSKTNRKLPKEFDAETYKKRNLVERFFGRIKRSFRRIATRYEKTSRNFMALIKLAAFRLWCEFYESAT
jgi:transposase|tara:strand:+ start:463 stop:894 length:432 start_codon:yes stop_codon:yes gene_type:complete